MIRLARNFTFSACISQISLTVARMTQERTTALDSLRDARFKRIEAGLGAKRICDSLRMFFHTVGVIVFSIVIVTPLPDVPGHII